MRYLFAVQYDVGCGVYSLELDIDDFVLEVLGARKSLDKDVSRTDVVVSSVLTVYVVPGKRNVDFCAFGFYCLVKARILFDKAPIFVYVYDLSHRFSFKISFYINAEYLFEEHYNLIYFITFFYE